MIFVSFEKIFFLLVFAYDMHRKKEWDILFEAPITFKWLQSKNVLPHGNYEIFIKHCFWSAERYTKFLTTCPTPIIKHFIKINVFVRWWPYEKKLSTKYFIYWSCTIRKVLVSEVVMWQVKHRQTKSMTSATNIFTFICECAAHICLSQINNVETKRCWVLLTLFLWSRECIYWLVYDSFIHKHR